MNKLSIILLGLIIWSCSINAQNYQYHTKSRKAIKLFEKAVEAADNRERREAVDNCYKAIAIDSTFLEAHVLLSEIYRYSGQDVEMVHHLSKVVSIDPHFEMEYYYILSEAEYRLGRYEEALSYLEFFLKHQELNDKNRKKVERIRDMIEFSIYAVNNPVPFRPINLGNGVNSQFDEYWPSLTADEETLVFTRLIPATDYGKAAGNYQEDLFVSHLKDGKYMHAYKMPGAMNTELNEGAQCISSDGRMCVITACNRPDGKGSCDLYLSYKQGQYWSEPINMGPLVNTGAWESNPSLSSNGKVLYFASNRSAGLGQMDIYAVELGKDGFPVESAINLGETINTEYNDCSPFIHPDGRTLYFASDGHIGMGDYDLFVSRLGFDAKWSKPENLGYPINTKGEERSMIVNAKGDLAMFASARERGKGLDIYAFPLHEKVKPITVTYVKGYIYDSITGARLAANIELIDLETGTVMVDDISDENTGEYLVCLPVDRDYAFNVSKDAYLFYSENFSLTDLEDPSEPYIMNIPLQPIREGVTIVLKNIFFDFNKIELKSESYPELKKVVDFMVLNPHVRIEIGGHTDNVGNKEFNKNLSTNRAKAVYTYLINKGIEENRLSYKGYDFSKPIASNETEEGRALNRRTEFKIVGITR
jgi:outer membrane protein OmpA-like peptidoglycan-associated protein